VRSETTDAKWAATLVGLAYGLITRGERVPHTDSESGERLRLPSALRGYARAEVDSLLQRLSDEIEQLKNERDDAHARVVDVYQRVGDELGELLQHSRDWADRIVAEAETEAEKIKDQARATVKRLRQDAEEESERVRAEAKLQAEWVVEQAEAKLDQMREAEDHARRRAQTLKRRLLSVVEQLDEEAEQIKASPGEVGDVEAVMLGVKEVEDEIDVSDEEEASSREATTGGRGDG
jgi:cell division septum initiation protein DivIVA